MSFNRLAYDTAAYTAGVDQSVGAGDYVLATPWHPCQPCLSVGAADGGRGGATCVSRPVVDVDSELLGITRKASKAPCDQHQPSDVPYCESVTRVRLCDEELGGRRQDTRLSNPPCTLRSTGWNRWEWLCQNPQERVLHTFDTMINSQLIARDSHRPVVPTPFDASMALPPNQDAGMFRGEVDLSAVCAPTQVRENLPTVSWRACNEIARY